MFSIIRSKAEADDEDARFRKNGSLLFLENFRSFDFDECFFSGGGDKRVVSFHSPGFAAFGLLDLAAEVVISVDEGASPAEIFSADLGSCCEGREEK